RRAVGPEETGHRGPETRDEKWKTIARGEIGGPALPVSRFALPAPGGLFRRRRAVGPEETGHRGPETRDEKWKTIARGETGGPAGAGRTSGPGAAGGRGPTA